MFHEGVAPALLLRVFHFPLNKLRRLFIHSSTTTSSTALLLVVRTVVGTVPVLNTAFILKKNATAMPIVNASRKVRYCNSGRHTWSDSIFSRNFLTS